MKTKKKLGVFERSLIALIFVALAEIVMPSLIPLGFFQFVKLDGNIIDIVLSVWPLFIWAILIGWILFLVATAEGESDFARYASYSYGYREGNLTGKVIGNFLVSVADAVLVRWWIFLCAIAFFKVANFFLLGFVGLDLIKWLFEYILVPLANFVTLGLFKEQLSNPADWAVAAAIVCVGASTTDYNNLKGGLGAVNFWFVSLVLLSVTFSHGMLAAIIVQFLYFTVITITKTSFDYYNSRS